VIRIDQIWLWTYVRDDRPHGGADAPAAWYCYSPDRKGVHPQTHLQDYSGILQADAYAGYNAGRVLEAGCWAHARRHFYDIHEKRPSAITTHVLDTIAALYRIEADIRGKPPDERRAVRQARAAPIVTALHAWLKEQLTTVSRKSVTADAIGYALNQWQALTRFLDDGRIEVDNNAAERALRAGGHHVQPSGFREAQRFEPGSILNTCVRAYRRPSCESHRRAIALERAALRLISTPVRPSRRYRPSRYDRY